MEAAGGEAAGSGLPSAAIPASGCIALYALKLDGVFTNPWGPQVRPEERYGPEVQETLLNLESQLSKNPFNAAVWNALLEVEITTKSCLERISGFVFPAPLQLLLSGCWTVGLSQ